MVSALEELPGVKKAFANYPEKKAVVSYDQSTVSLEKICQTLLKVGYVANLKANDKEASTEISGKVPVNKDFQLYDLVCFC